jgi:hypothetical protein
VLCYTFGDDTRATIREGLEKLHPGVNPTMMMIEGREVEDDWSMSDWMSRPGTSDVRVNWKMETPYHKFWRWSCGNEVDLGDEPLDGRSPAERWASLKSRSPALRKQEDYLMFIGQEEVNWSDLPVLHLTLVPRSIQARFFDWGT